MSFDLRNDANRVRVALYLPVEQYDTVLNALKTAQEKSIFLVDEIKADLAKLEDLSTKLYTELSSPNSALTRADVLSFSEGQRAHGMLLLQYQLILKLASALGLTPNLRVIEDIAFSKGLNLGSRPINFGVVQRS